MEIYVIIINYRAGVSCRQISTCAYPKAINSRSTVSTLTKKDRVPKFVKPFMQNKEIFSSTAAVFSRKDTVLICLKLKQLDV